YFDLGGGTQSVTVTERGSCSWQVINNLSNWLSMPSGTDYAGSATVTLSVSATSSPRTGVLIIAGKEVSIVQGTYYAIDSVTPAAGRASGGQQFRLSGSFANLSAVTV